jgi:hypothetical protein
MHFFIKLLAFCFKMFVLFTLKLCLLNLLMKILLLQVVTSKLAILIGLTCFDNDFGHCHLPLVRIKKNL